MRCFLRQTHRSSVQIIKVPAIDSIIIQEGLNDPAPEPGVLVVVVSVVVSVVVPSVVSVPD